VTGIDGDYYLDVDNGNVYQKVAGSWTLIGNIRGPAGPYPGIISLLSPVTISNTSSETRIIGITLPADFLKAGTSLRIVASGVIGDAAGIPTTTWRVRAGASSLTGNIVTSVAPTMATAQTNKAWFFQALITCRTAGVSGTIIGECIVWGEYATTFPNFIKGSATTSTVAVNTTAARVFELTFQFSIPYAANTLTCHVASIEVVTP
jgi:hypothetical protein